MTKILEGITIETFSDAVRQGQIKPGQRFAIVLDGESEHPVPRLGLTEIAARMRATAVERGMTTDIFDTLLAKN